MRARIRTAIADLSQLTRSARWCVILVAIAVLGTALILARQVRHGMWIGVDPAEQILIARNLVAGNQFAGWSLHTTIDYSPLYSILLALPGLFGIDALAVAGPLNALLFGLTIYVSTRWLRRRLQSTFLLFWAAGTLLLSLPLVTLSSQVLADPLFILLTMLFLFSFLRFLESGERSSLLHAAVFVSLAFLTRYIGFALLASGSLLILLQRGSKYRERLKNAVLFALIAAFPTGLWLLKNFLAHGQLHAMYSARITLPHNLQSGFQALYVWVTARWLDWETGSPPGCAGPGCHGPVATGVVAAGNRCRSGLGHPIHPSAPAARQHDAGSGPVLPCLPGHDRVRHHSSGWGALNQRYLAPLYIPLLIMVVLPLDRFLRHVAQGNLFAAATFAPPQRLRQVATGALMLALSLWLEPHVRLYFLNFEPPRNRGAQDLFWTPNWLNPDIVQLIKYPPQFSNERRLYSNAARLLNFHGDWPDRYRWLPLRYTELPGWLEQAECRAGEPCIVWLHDAVRNRRMNYRAAALRGLSGLTLLAESAEGLVFGLSERPADWNLTWRSRYESVVAGEPVARSDFDVYLDAEGRNLTFLREPCSHSDTQARFFLLFDPAGADDFEVDFRRQGARFDEICMLGVPLPERIIERARAGQHDGSELLWRATVPLPAGAAGSASAAPDRPVVHADYDIYHDAGKNALVYLREPCNRADTEARFFLHLIPADVEDLPEVRRQHGFDNLDFEFEWRGGARLAPRREMRGVCPAA